MATLEGDRSTAQRTGVSYRGATSRVPDTFTEDVQANAAVPGSTDNDLQSWLSWLAARVPLNIHDHITTQITSPDGDDRFAASAEVAAGDPTRFITLRQIGQWIKANFGFGLHSDVTRQAPGLSGSDRLVISDESAAGDPNSWVNLTALSNWLRPRLAFDIHDDLSTALANVADADRIPISDESVNGDPNRYVTATVLAAFIATKIHVPEVQSLIELLVDLHLGQPHPDNYAEDTTTGAGIGSSGSAYTLQTARTENVFAKTDQVGAGHNAVYLLVRLPHNEDQRVFRLRIRRRSGNVQYIQVSHMTNLGNSSDVSYKYFTVYNQTVLNAGDSATLEKAGTVNHIGNTEYGGILTGTMNGTFGTESVRVLTQAQYDAIADKKRIFYLISDSS